MHSSLLATRWLRHLLFWLAVAAYFTLPQLVYPDYRHTVASYFFGFAYQRSPHFLLLLFAYALGVGMVYAYVFLGWALPPLLAGRLGVGFARFALLTIGICYLFRLLSALHVAVLDPWLRHRPPHGLDPRHFQGLFVNQVYIYEYLTIILLLATYKLLGSWRQQQQAAGQLAHAQAQANLRAAQARLHPPLLLASLSTLEEHIQAQADQAPALVLTLSQFLRYVLYDSQAAPEVPLAADLAALRQYLTLKQAQLGGQMALAFYVPSPTASSSVVPLLWLSLLESACAGAQLAEPAWLNVQVSSTMHQMKVSISYNINEPAVNEPVAVDNLRQLLRARYPGRHVLRLLPEPGLCTIGFTLDLPTATPLTGGFPSATHEAALPTC